MSIRVHRSFILYLSLIGLIDGVSCAVLLLVALFIHESGHVIAGRILGESYALIEITPLGGMISYKAGHSSFKGIRGVCIAAAGPLCSLSAVYILCNTPMHSLFSQETFRSFLCMNLSMFLFNIMPVLPLDGGRIVFCIGYYLFPIAGLIDVLTALGRIAGALCMILSLYGLLSMGKLNLTLLAAGGYMMFCAAKQREVLFASSLHTAIQERLTSSNTPHAVQLVSLDRQELLSSVIPSVCRSAYCVFAIESGNELRLISEQRVLEKLLASPSATFAEAFP